MKLFLENIGIIKEAKVNIGGLTVITGVNGTGKTTVGKCLYTVIKMLSNCENHFTNRVREEKLRILRNFRSPILTKENYEISHGYFEKRKRESSLDLYKHYSNIINDFLESCDDIEKYIEEYHLTEDVLKIYKDNILLQFDAYYDNNYYDNVYEHVNMFEGKNKDICKKFIIEFIQFIYETDKIYTIEKTMKSIYFNYLKSEFGGHPNSFDCSNCKIEFESNEGRMNYEYSNSADYSLDLIESNKDVTFISSPFVIDKINRTIFKSKKDSLYKKEDDLIRKLQNVQEEVDILKDYTKTNELLRFIENIIDGKIEYNSENQELEYINAGNKIAMLNTATGVKSFAILYRLINNDELKNGDVLILDEPEVHLHPVWQVKFAEVIVKLIKEIEINVVISTHSSNFVEALLKSAKLHGISKKSNFYTSEPTDASDNMRVLKNVEGDLSSIFSHFGKAFEDIDNLTKEYIRKG